jgi:conjugative transfer signal peptidase TraF
MFSYRLQRTIKLSFIATVVIWSCILSLRYALGKYIAINDTLSEPLGVYKLSTPEQIESGAIYSVSIPETYYIIAKKLGYSGDGLFLKKVVGLPGDRILITESGILINNRLLATSQAQSIGLGIRLYPLPIGYNHVLAENEYWTYGEGLHSYDSRYYGVITRDNIHNKATFWFYNKGVEEWQKQLHSLWQTHKN